MYRVTNTTNDRLKAHLHRTAGRFEYEPYVGGERLRLGQTIEMSDQHFADNEEIIRRFESWGMVSVEHVPEAEETKTAEPPSQATINEEPGAGSSSSYETKPLEQLAATPTEGKKGPGKRR